MRVLDKYKISISNLCFYSPQKCTNDVMSAFPEIQSGYDYGNDLLADNQLSDEDRDKIEKEMNNIGEDFKALQQDINAEQDRSAISFLTSVFRFGSPPQFLSFIIRYFVRMFLHRFVCSLIYLPCSLFVCPCLRLLEHSLLLLSLRSFSRSFVLSFTRQSLVVLIILLFVLSLFCSSFVRSLACSSLVP